MAEASTDGRATIPRDRDNDYTREAADQRRAFVEEHTDQGRTTGALLPEADAAMYRDKLRA